MNKEDTPDFDHDTVTLQDESGSEQEFDILDAVETDSARYVALLPIFDNPADEVQSSGELLIMRVEEDGDGEVLVTIDDDDEFNDILSVFEERLSEYYEIDHDDE